jgi:hypothetical protein
VAFFATGFLADFAFALVVTVTAGNSVSCAFAVAVHPAQIATAQNARFPTTSSPLRTIT